MVRIGNDNYNHYRCNLSHHLRNRYHAQLVRISHRQCFWRILILPQNIPRHHGLLYILNALLGDFNPHEEVLEAKVDRGLDGVQ